MCIATRYVLDSQGIEYRQRRIISAPVQTGTGADPASYKMGTECFQGARRPGPGVNHHPHLASAGVKKILELISTPPLCLHSKLYSEVYFTYNLLCCHNVFGRATRQGLEGSGLKPDQICPGAHPFFYTMDTELFPGVKRLGSPVDHSNLSLVSKQVYIYTHPPLCCMACYGANFVFRTNIRTL